MAHDQLYRYLFENYAVRGELVTVSVTLQKILENHNYPQPVKILLAELLVATSLLTATLKFDGDITVQLQGDGPMRLAVIKGNHRQQMRGLARVQGVVPDNADLRALTGKGFLVITIMSRQGARYQGVVELERDTLAECLQDYFIRSEQLPGRLFIRVGEIEGKMVAGGLLLQALAAQNFREEDFGHLAALTETIKAGELFTLSAHEVLWRLYHEEEATLYPPQGIEFKCVCSYQRCVAVLQTLADEEVDEMLAQEDEINMHCDYCDSNYVFPKPDIKALRDNSPQLH